VGLVGARAQKTARAAAADRRGRDDDPAVAELAGSQDAASDVGWRSSPLACRRWSSPACTTRIRTRRAVGEYDPDLTVPPGLVRDALAAAGRDPAATDADGAAVIDLPAGAWGIGQGDAVQSFLEENGAERESYTWLHGDTDRPLDAHLVLDGYQFDRLGRCGGCTNHDSFPEVEVLAPGDHDGCTCDAWITWATVADGWSDDR
jgi:hypothetical protein